MEFFFYYDGGKEVRMGIEVDEFLGERVQQVQNFYVVVVQVVVGYLRKVEEVLNSYSG